MTIGTGVVQYWELKYTEHTGARTVMNLRTWEDATEAFRAAIKLGAKSAIVYAVSGRGGSRKISTWEHNT